MDLMGNTETTSDTTPGLRALHTEYDKNDVYFYVSSRLPHDNAENVVCVCVCVYFQRNGLCVCVCVCVLIRSFFFFKKKKN